MPWKAVAGPGHKRLAACSWQPCLQKACTLECNSGNEPVETPRSLPMSCLKRNGLPAPFQESMSIIHGTRRSGSGSAEQSPPFFRREPVLAGASAFLSRLRVPVALDVHMPAKTNHQPYHVKFSSCSTICPNTPMRAISGRGAHSIKVSYPRHDRQLQTLGSQVPSPFFSGELSVPHRPLPRRRRSPESHPTSESHPKCRPRPSG